MTEYDEWPHHILNGVPQSVLDVARNAVSDFNDVAHQIEPDDLEPLADAIIADLRRAGYLAWPNPTERLSSE